MTTTSQTDFYTAYPDAWFGRSAKGKMHCYTTGGNSVESEPRNRGIVETLCGIDAQPSGNRFQPNQPDGNPIVCSRCVKAAKRIFDAEHPFVVGSVKGPRDPGKRFATHDEAAAYISMLPGHEDGRYYLDGPEVHA